MRFYYGVGVEYQECEAELLNKIAYRFTNPALLRQALTHKSYSNEHPGAAFPHNERLEFLGDAVLDLVISHRIFRDFPDLPEGELTRIRAELVSASGLAAVARELSLGDCLLLGRGEERSGGRQKESLVADALEALLGAVFCDGGFANVVPVIDTLFAAAIVSAANRKTGIDHKTRLQEVLQGRYGQPPSYILTRAEGPDHQRIYSVEVRLADRPIGSGQGRSKKAAEQAAACSALAWLEAYE